MTVAELGERMSAREFAEWMAMERIDPVTRIRDDIHHAMLSCLVHNAVAKKQRNPSEFLPFAEAKPRDRAAEAAALESFFAAYEAAT